MKKALSLCVILGSTCFAQAAPLGVIDLGRIGSESHYAKRMQDELAQDFERDRAAFMASEQAYHQEVDAFEKEVDLLSEAERQEREKNLMISQETLRDQHQKLMDRINQRREEDMKNFLKSMKEEAARVARRQKIGLVLPSEVVIFSEETRDLTEEVLKALDQSK